MENTVRVPKTHAGEKTFFKIIEVSKLLFSERGYLSTSINAIIAEAKIAAGTFYKYFDDKRAVYDYLLNDYSLQIRRKISNEIRHLDSREEKERIGLRTFIRFALEDKLSYRIIWESLFVDKQLFIDYYTNFAKVYIKQLEQAVTSSEIDPHIDLETLAFVLMGISNFVGLQAVFKHHVSDDELDFIVNQVMYILKNGMFAKEIKSEA